MSKRFDQIESLGHSLIQHGPGNQRVYLMKADPRDLLILPDRLEQLARANGYTKIFAKLPKPFAETFQQKGYEEEAHIPGFYRGKRAAVFMCRYLDETRRQEKNPQLVRSVLDVALTRATDPTPGASLPGTCVARELGPVDADILSELYREVFATYPFPIHDPGYLRRTMETHIRYFGVFEQGKLIAGSSSELDNEEQNSEMTDFATRPSERGRGLALYLLRSMEQVMQDEKILTPFTIARAYSYGMNITFARAGYTYAGTLTNNTQISGQIESMNVWYHTLARREQASGLGEQTPTHATS